MKRKVALLSALLLTAVAGFTGNIFGDANGDGKVNIADVVAVVNAAMGNDPDNFDEAMADINGNGKIDEEDASLLAESLLNPPFDRTKALEDDYERAFTQGYLPMKYSARYRKQQITSLEFKTLLETVMEKYSPELMDYFNRNISDEDVLITRGLACCMVYYVARSIGVETRNVTVETGWPEDMWVRDYSDDSYSLVLPYLNELGEDDYPEDKGWRSKGFGDYQTPWMWNWSHISLFSDIEVIAKDKEAMSFHWNDPMTWEDAVRAITRLYDSFEPEMKYADLDDPRVTMPNADIITSELITEAAKKEIHVIDDMPRIIGVQLGGGGNQVLELSKQFGTTVKEVKEIADWGFNSMLSTFGWKHLFTDNMQVNLSVFEALDAIIAAAMKYGLHLNLRSCAMPGCGAYCSDDIRGDYVMDNDILNEEKRERCRVIWRTIATRYKDVPNVNLSFQPISEMMGLNDGNNGGQTFDPEQVFDYVDVMIDAIREVSPERFIYFDGYIYDIPVASDVMTPIALTQYHHVMDKYDNVLPSYIHMATAYGFYEYNDGDGNIDYAHHSVWVPTYPITLYDANGLLLAGGNDKMTIDGCLPKGTTLDFYLSTASDGTEFQICADDRSLYEEIIVGDQVYHVGYAVAFGEQFRSSDKKISVTLEDEAQEVVFFVGKGGLNWCGIEVKLPETYTVERWWKPSDWDIELGLVSPELKCNWVRKPTSSVQIGSTYNDWQDSETGFHITIKNDVTFTSDHFYSRACKEETEKMVKDACGYFPRWACRFEDILVTDMAGALNYWDDTMEVFQRYGVDVWVSALGLLSEENLAPFRICDYEGEDFEDHHNFNVKLLKVLQKYMDK